LFSIIRATKSSRRRQNSSMSSSGCISARDSTPAAFVSPSVFSVPFFPPACPPEEEAVRNPLELRVFGNLARNARLRNFLLQRRILSFGTSGPVQPDESVRSGEESFALSYAPNDRQTRLIRVPTNASASGKPCLVIVREIRSISREFSRRQRG